MEFMIKLDIYFLQMWETVKNSFLLGVGLV